MHQYIKHIHVVDILKIKLRTMPSMSILKVTLHNKNRLNNFFRLNKLSYDLTKYNRDTF